MSEATVLVGDCREKMAEMPESSVDAIVCDPPYDLTSVSRNGSPRQNDPTKPFGRHNLQAAGGFMGKAWDGTGVAFQVETWAEAFRVLKPGGHLLAFGGTRTYHRMVCAIEDAGFEIRDSLHWVYGSGFPKSKSMKDIGRPELGTALKPAHEPIVMARKPLAEKNVAQNVLTHGTGALNVDGCRVQSSLLSSEVRNSAAASRIGGNGIYHGSEGTAPYSDNPHPESARHHAQGRWPPNLLLSHSPGCRPTGEIRRVKGAGSHIRHNTAEGHNSTNSMGKSSGGWTPKGHGDPDGYEGVEEYLCVEGCPVREMDLQSGQRPAGDGRDWSKEKEHGTGNGSTYLIQKPTGQHYSDSGGASRFFPRFEPEPPFRYVAKASRRERNAGLEGMPPKIKKDIDPDTGEEYTYEEKIGNPHPTVKPISLIKWLVRLVTPPGGVVLDPFMGSGSTGCAAALEGFDFIGIEMDAEYAEIARRRIAYWSDAERQEKPAAPAPKRNTYGFASTDYVRHCPKHDQPQPSGMTTYACGCPKIWTKREEVIPAAPSQMPLETLF